MNKIIKFLLNKKILLIIASTLAFLFTLAFVISHLNGIVFYWNDYFWFAYIITLTYFVAYYIPILVSHLIDIHQNNLKDIKEKEVKSIK